VSLQTRLAALISAIGADVKDLQTRVTSLELTNTTGLDGGTPSGTQTGIVDGGAP